MTDEYKLLVVKLAFYYQIDLDDESVNFMAAALARNLTVNELKTAIEIYYDNPSNEFFPRPVTKLVKLIKDPSPILSDEDTARDSAGRAWEAISKFGRDRATEAKEFIGGAGWQAIERFGGWSNNCLTTKVEDKGIWIAQMRDQILTQVRMSRAAILNSPQELPSPKLGVNKILEYAKNSVKNID